MVYKRFLSALILACSVFGSAKAAFDLSVSIASPASFTASQLSVLQSSIAGAEQLWESVITGYQPGVSLSGVTITVQAGSSFADTQFPATVSQAGFVLATSATVRINPSVIDIYGSWDGSGPANPNPAYIGLNYIDDLLAHEFGHALGIGTLWRSNNLAPLGSGMYSGAYGLAAYRQEFLSPNASFVPVELAGAPGTQNNHWDQLMRSSTQEGNPNDPWSLSPLTGIVDTQGRDLGLELMTGALDPDYGEPFLSMTTIQSLRDLGFAVVPEPGSAVLLGIYGAAWLTRRGQFRRRPHSSRSRSGVSSRRLSTTS